MLANMSNMLGEIGSAITLYLNFADTLRLNDGNEAWCVHFIRGDRPVRQDDAVHSPGRAPEAARSKGK